MIRKTIFLGIKKTLITIQNNLNIVFAIVLIIGVRKLIFIISFILDRCAIYIIYFSFINIIIYLVLKLIAALKKKEKSGVIVLRITCDISILSLFCLVVILFLIISSGNITNNQKKCYFTTILWFLEAAFWFLVLYLSLYFILDDVLLSGYWFLAKIIIMYFFMSVGSIIFIFNFNTFFGHLSCGRINIDDLIEIIN